MLEWLQTLVPVADLYDLEISRLTDVRSSPPPYDKPNESPVIGGYGFELHETRAFQTTQKHNAVHALVQEGAMPHQDVQTKGIKPATITQAAVRFA